ncbi:acireductone synthase [Nocardia sp. NPDC050697]|uniref:acireductone synthase n=1 Tax=Nocardia sp. NPDC050697 TaxID=3155158 RepID=UPI00340734A4
MTTAVVLDIEGTTSSTAAVRERLYGYTRRELPRWIGTDEAAPVRAATRELAGRPGATPAEIAELLLGWLGSDAKAEPLKLAQGLICHAGFRAGALRGAFYPDVAPALRGWHAAGLRLAVYSSGSERNQRDWFGHAEGGELASLVSGWFDLTTAGPKREPGSYRRIAAAMNTPPDELLFLSDHPDELDAAVAAGWRVAGVHRAGEPNAPRPPHRWIAEFGELALP